MHVCKQRRNQKVESNLQKAIASYALMKRYIVIRINSGAMKVGDTFTRFYTIENTKASAGLSDLVLFKNGSAKFIEVKKPGGKQTEKQKDFESLAKRFGMQYFVCDSFESAKEVIDEEVISNRD